jgi:hypothetical protein
MAGGLYIAVYDTGNVLETRDEIDETALANDSWLEMLGGEGT